MATTKTVSTHSVEVETEKQQEIKPEVKRKTLTNWRIFEEAGFIPATIKCDGYKGNHPSDLSCHTRFVPNVENVLRHINPDHGGGWLRIKFRISDTKKSDLWRALEEAGVELKDFTCPHCDTNVPVSPRRILYHLNPHPGRNRVNLDPGVLCMTLGPDTIEDLDENSDLYES